MERKQWEGRVIEGRFLLRQYLGGSPHSAVYLTEVGDGAQRKAAVKLVPADSGTADAWTLRRELAAKLSHPGLLSIYSFGTCRIDDTVCAYVVMEQSDEDLSQVIPTRPLTVAEARELLLAVVEILKYVHGKGFVHGRLIPANLMAASDRIKISSDGLMRAGDSSGELWEFNPNDPPESHGGMTPAGDVWWLGMTLVEALTQHLPAWDPKRADDPAVPETLPAPFRDIARRCLRTDPRSRCTLAEISQALQPARPATPERSRTAAPASAKPAAPEGTRKRKYLLPVAVAVLAGVFVTGAILTRLQPENSSAGTAAAPPVAQEAAAATSPQTVQPVSTPPEAPAPAAGEIAPAATAPAAAEPPAAPEPAPAPKPAPTASAPVGDSQAGDGIIRHMPEIPASYFATITGRFTVSVRVTLDPSGSVVDAALDSRPNSVYFDRVSVEAARRWKFKPGDSGATRVVRFDFSREGCTAR